MVMEVTFAVGGSEASISGVERAEVDDDHLRCFGGSNEEPVLISAVPLDALLSVTATSGSSDCESCPDGQGDCSDGGHGDSGDGSGGTGDGHGDGSGDGHGDGSGDGHGDGSGGHGDGHGGSGDGNECKPDDAGNDGYDAAALVTADPSEAGADATHTVALQVDQDVDDFAYFRVDYAAVDAHTNVNDVDEDNVVRFGVDTNDDGVVEQSIATGDWSVSHGGSGYTLRVRNEEWDGTLEPGDDLILEFDGVTNPETPGTYEVELVLNGHQTAKTAYTVGAGDIHSPDVADDTDAN